MQKQIKSLTIGILGGGQLGRMITHAAQSLGYKTVIFTDEAEAPASFATNATIVANYDNESALRKFCDEVDIVTFEFENIPVKSVEFVESLKPVYPSAEVLKITQHRILEKSFLNEIGVATADFAEIKNLEDLIINLKKFGKAILKTALMGYDGKGQFVLENETQARQAWDSQISKITQPLILEKFCPFKSEISIIIARSTNGEISCYEPLTNIHKNGILDKSIYPAKISENCKKSACEIATKIATNLDLQGILAVEFFVMEDEKLLVNELAPRPHNSGHFSMNAAKTSQFEQLIRAINGLTLGNSEFHSSGFMKNLIGEEVNDLAEFLENKNAKIHLYGKAQVKAGRKMGHVNILS